MLDIKLTLSKDTVLRSPNALEESKWVENEGTIFYPLQSKPKDALPGCWVYFIRDGKLVSRAKAKAFIYKDKSSLGATYTGVSNQKSGWKVEVMPPMVLTKHAIEHNGFQGFRYVQNAEIEKFQQAFT
jgi:hypothetical protein